MNIATKFFGAGLVALGLTAGAANATVVYTASQSQTSATLVPTFNTSLTFDQFDPAANGGNILNSVHITLDGTANTGPGTMQCFVGGTSSGTCSATLTAQITMILTAAATNLVTVISATSSIYSGIPVGTSPVLSDTNTASNSAEFCINSEPNCTAINASVVNLFSGTGTITLSLAGTGLVTTANSDGTASGSDPLAGFGTATITYDYIQRVVCEVDCPEPMSIALLATGIAGIRVARRRRSN